VNEIFGAVIVGFFKAVFKLPIKLIGNLIAANKTFALIAQIVFFGSVVMVVCWALWNAFDRTF
jgi:F0F1-type ATP synthase membrane subunit a